MTFFFTLLFILLVFWRPQEWLLPWLFGLPMLDAVFACALLALLVETDSGKLVFPRRAPQVYLIPGVWVAAMASHGAHAYLAGMMATAVPVFKICFFTLLLFCVLDRPWRLRAVSNVFVFMACFMAINALLQQQRGYGFAGLRPFFHNDRFRSTFFGIFEDPNDLAQILATSIPFAFCMTIRRSLVSVLAGLAITALLVSGVLATHSRGGIVALATIIAVSTVLVLPARWLPVAMSLLVITALALCPFSAGVLDDSAHDRVAFWGEANRVFIRQPIFGVGRGMFAEYISGDRVAHNAFVTCYTEMGLVGYWFWFGLLQLGVLGAWRTRVALGRPVGEDQKWLGRFCGLAIAAMAGFSASSYFLSRAFIYPMFFMFGLLGAIPVVAQHLLPDEHPPVLCRRDVTVWCTVGSLLSVAYIYVSIIFLNRAFYGG